MSELSPHLSCEFLHLHDHYYFCLISERNTRMQKWWSIPSRKIGPFFQSFTLACQESQFSLPGKNTKWAWCRVWAPTSITSCKHIYYHDCCNNIKCTYFLPPLSETYTKIHVYKYRSKNKKEKKSWQLVCTWGRHVIIIISHHHCYSRSTKQGTGSRRQGRKKYSV